VVVSFPSVDCSTGEYETSQVLLVVILLVITQAFPWFLTLYNHWHSDHGLG
jgi:hypothetical protein